MSALEEYTGIGLQSPEEAYPALAPAPRATVTRGSSKRTVLEQIYLGLLAHAAGRAGPRGMLSAGAGYMGGQRQAQEVEQQRTQQAEKFNIATMMRQREMEQNQRQARVQLSLAQAQIQLQIRGLEADERRLRREGKERAAEGKLRRRLQLEEIQARNAGRERELAITTKRTQAGQMQTLGPVGAGALGIPEGEYNRDIIGEMFTNLRQQRSEAGAMARTQAGIAARPGGGGGGGDAEPITMASINADIARVLTRIHGSWDWVTSRWVSGLPDGPDKDQAISDLRSWVKQRAAMGGPPDITAEDMQGVGRGGGREGGRSIDLGRGSATPRQVLGGSRMGAGTNAFDWDSLRSEHGVTR